MNLRAALPGCPRCLRQRLLGCTLALLTGAPAPGIGTRQRAAEAAFLVELLGVLPVIDYVTAVARIHARLRANVRRSDTARGGHDLHIAACAVATDREPVSTDTKAGFDTVPETSA